MKNKVSVIILNYNGQQWLENCLNALYDQTMSNFDCYLVDNNSKDNSVAFIKNQFPKVHLIQNKINLGFAKAVNEVVKNTETEFVFLLNNDTIIDKEVLFFLLKRLSENADNIVACQALMLQIDAPEKIDDAGDLLSWYGLASKGMRDQIRTKAESTNKIFSASGGATLFRTEWFNKMKGFDEDFFAYLEDVDLGLRGQLAGYNYVLEPKALVFHKSHGSQKTRSQYVRWLTRNRLLLFYRNIPTALLIKKLPLLLYGRIYHFIAYGKPIASILGYIDFIRLWPKTIRLRKQRQLNIKIDHKDIELLLHNNPPNPPLSFFMKSYLNSIINLFKSAKK